MRGKMKNIAGLFLAIILASWMAAEAAAKPAWIGSKTSNKYHHADCKWVKDIRPENILQFASPDEAARAGYIPCPTCKPPLSSPPKTQVPAVAKKETPQAPMPPPPKAYPIKIIISLLMLSLLLFVPFLSGLLEIMFEGFSLNKKTIEGAKEP